ncbi:hypothetical protein A2U01_0098602, partial [Trifolium medium]|nr:hypothetical protein [Trifolium medium]
MESHPRALLGVEKEMKIGKRKRWDFSPLLPA